MRDIEMKEIVNTRQWSGCSDPQKSKESNTMITSFLCVSFYSLKYISIYLVSFSHLSEVKRALPSPYNGWESEGPRCG